MKKLVTVMLSLALAVCALLSLTACTMNVSGKTFKYEKWTTEAQIDDDTRGLIDAQIDRYVGTMVYEFKADGKGVATMGGQTAEFTWKQDGDTLTISLGTEAHTCKIEGEKVVISDNFDGVAVKIIFKQA